MTAADDGKTMMTNHIGMTRREAISRAVAGAALLTAGAQAFAAKPSTPVKIMKQKNSEFYKKDGSFDGEKARKAYYAMMKRFSYPITDKLKGKDFWAIDFGLNDFVNVGMAGIFWWNDKENNYFGHEIYLLPGQMIVEHAHVKTPDAKPKMEAWQVRHGSIFTFGEGDATTPCPIELPKSQEKFITARHCQMLKPGEISALNRAEAKHFMIAGPQGAIVTEYATYHDNAGLRFTNPGVKF
jgi:D-lyxose ketol-isomerase